MKRLISRTLALILTLVMALGIAPSNAMAEASWDDIADNGSGTGDGLGGAVPEGGDSLSGDNFSAPSAATFTAPSNLLGNGDTASDNNLVTSKYVTDNEDGTYTVHIDAYSKGTVETTLITKPCDIVLVLDVSGSMRYTYGNETPRSMKEYCNGMLSWYSNNNISNGTPYLTLYDKDGHKVKVTENNKTYTYKYGSGRNEVTLGTSRGEFVKPAYEDSDLELYAYIRIHALQDAVCSFIDSTIAKSPESTITLVKFAYAADPSGASLNSSNENYTKILMRQSSNAQALKTAVNSLIAGGATELNSGMLEGEECFGTDENKNKVMIIFTDGEPTDGENSLPTAISLKQSGVTLYSVGIGETSDTYMKELVGDANHMSASNAAQLTDIFESISNDIITPGVSFGSTAYVKDIVSDYFTLPAGATASNITVETAACTGISNGAYTFGTPSVLSGANVSVNGKNITVSGFDYKENCCLQTSTGVKGEKLMISFVIKPEPDFWGGNNVPTNGEGSGIYDSANNIVESLPMPYACVEVKQPEYTANNFGIYAGGETPAMDELFNRLSVPAEPWKTAFVTISYEDTTESVSNTEDGEYASKVIVAPKDAKSAGTVGAEAQSKDATATAYTYIYDPTVSFKDSTIYLSETAPAYGTANLDKVEWAKKSADAGKHTMYEASAPKLTFEYSQDPDAFEDCTPVNVTNVKNGSAGIIGFTDGLESAADFTVHVLVPELETSDAAVYVTKTYDIEPLVAVKADGWHDVNGDVGIPAATGLAPTELTDVTFAEIATGTVTPALTDCTVYSVASAKVGGKNVPELATQNGGVTEYANTLTVHVLVPALSFEDKTIYLGESATVQELYKDKETKWADVNNDTIADSVKATAGDAPALTVRLTLSANDSAANVNIKNGAAQPKVKGDYDFKASVNMDGTDITKHATLERKDCTTGAHEDETQATIHVLPCELTLTKAGGDARDSYIFVITYQDPWDAGKKVTLHEALRGGSSVTLVDLPVATYTVSEDAEWSWRYRANDGVKEAVLTHDAHTGSVTITNTLETRGWLSAEAFAVNRWNAGNTAVTRVSQGYYTSRELSFGRK